MPTDVTARGDRSHDPSVYRLKLTLRDVSPMIWRRIEVLGDTTLPRLHRIFQIAMGWEDSHLHAFVVGATTYGSADRDFALGFVSERGVRLAHIVTAPKRRFRYEYDFGDGWMHEIVVEAIQPKAEQTPCPRFIDGRNACPPEDVGGPPGYEAFLESFRDPDHEDYEETVEWVGRRFNPAVFDVAHIESAFARLAAADAKRARRQE